MPCPCCFGALRPPEFGPVRLDTWYCLRCDLLLPAEALDEEGAEDGVTCPVHGEVPHPEAG
jgi:hypothetical protein